VSDIKYFCQQKCKFPAKEKGCKCGISFPMPSVATALTKVIIPHKLIKCGRALFWSKPKF
jgi:hypothetical protein